MGRGGLLKRSWLSYFLVQGNSESFRIDLKGLESDQLKQIREAFASFAKEKKLEVKAAKLATA